MTIEGSITVGVATAQACLTTAASFPEDPEVAVQRIGILQVLLLQAERLGSTPLLDTYRTWLQSAVDVFGTGEPEAVRAYLRNGALLNAELEFAALPGMVAAAGSEADGTTGAAGTSEPATASTAASA